VGASRILTANEIRTILSELKRKARRSSNTAQNLILFRLACCCSLRVSEATSLRLCEVRLGTRPTLKVKGKGGKVRVVPLHWDAGTLEDLRAWKEHRKAQGATGSDLLIVTRDGGQIDRLNARSLRLALQTSKELLAQ
jgi:integrase